MSVQHEYQGGGDPNGIVTADVNSHYLNLDDQGVWMCISRSGNVSQWALIGGPLSDAAGERYDINGLQYFDGVVGQSVQFVFDLPNRLLSNVEISGNPAEFFTSDPYSRVEIRPVANGDLMVCVTPLTEY
ncbi:hypothetical protein F7R01_00935 [Pseudomonas argentinensis]|uniref:Uncharacterized protein n=1 Tax=Phytopseudomonas argentinensis TaxID=289370 RepID=A0A1I3NS68_9GAMM|nr:hypothetical protein [Pseudomonas argentinensis]KAB0549820.1 hypothetical protein F7R01_00935 [Pseudomonas argentinensis]SFJ12032.1 hypothetical protein SAMN05216602_3987 [Pseudomonas argentinensis]